MSLLNNNHRYNQNLVWDVATLSWIAMLQPATSGGGGGGAVTVADGADVTQGAVADAAVITDTTGTVSGKLRGLVKIFASVWDSVNGRLKVDGSAVTQPVQGINFDGITGAAPLSPVTVGGHYLATQPVYSDDAVTSFGSTQRGALVVAPGVEGFPISAVALPLPTGASTETTLSSVNTVQGAVADVPWVSGNATVIALLKTIASKYITEFDFDGGTNLIYFGQALTSSSTGSDVWQIRKFAYDGSNNLVSMLYADGTTAFTKTWTSRASYTYS